MADFAHFLSFCCPSNRSDKQGRERFLHQGECLESCPAGHAPAQGHTCLPCPDNCELCHHPHICTRCVSGYVLGPTNSTCEKLECGQGETALGSPRTCGWGRGYLYSPDIRACQVPDLMSSLQVTHRCLLSRNSSPFLFPHISSLAVPDPMQHPRSTADPTEREPH